MPTLCFFLQHLLQQEEGATMAGCVFFFAAFAIRGGKGGGAQCPPLCFFFTKFVTIRWVVMPPFVCFFAAFVAARGACDAPPRFFLEHLLQHEENGVMPPPLGFF
jgi:hypothetical protein